MCTINEDCVMFGSWNIRHNKQKTTLDHLEPFDPPNNLKNQNFEKMKKTPEDILHLHRAGKISFSGARKSVLLKASSGEHYAPCNFVHLVTLRGTLVHLTLYLAMHQMKYVMERWSNAIIFCNFLTSPLKGYPRKGNPDFASHGKLYITWLWS